jgi:Spy/CpxP family protein refolding chaperone
MSFNRLLLYCLQGLLIISLGLIITPVGSAAPLEGEPVLSGLDLTPEQGRLIRDLKAQFRQEEKEIRKKMMLKRMELVTLSPGEFRGEKGEDLRRQLQALMLQARERALSYQQQALSILTPEQKKKLPPDSDLGFHCQGWSRGGGPGTGMGRGMGRGRGNPKDTFPLD